MRCYNLINTDNDSNCIKKISKKKVFVSDTIAKKKIESAVNLIFYFILKFYFGMVNLWPSQSLKCLMTLQMCVLSTTDLSLHKN